MSSDSDSRVPVNLDQSTGATSFRDSALRKRDHTDAAGDDEAEGDAVSEVPRRCAP